MTARCVDGSETWSNLRTLVERCLLWSPWKMRPDSNIAKCFTKLGYLFGFLADLTHSLELCISMCGVGEISAGYSNCALDLYQLQMRQGRVTCTAESWRTARGSPPVPGSAHLTLGRDSSQREWLSLRTVGSSRQTTSAWPAPHQGWEVVFSVLTFDFKDLAISNWVYNGKVFHLVDEIPV